MPAGDPVEEALRCVADLRAAIEAERAALAALDLDRVAAALEQRDVLQRAWREAATTLRHVPRASDPRLRWARRQVLADLDALRRTWLQDARRRPAQAAALEAMATALRAREVDQAAGTRPPEWLD